MYRLRRVSLPLLTFVIGISTASALARQLDGATIVNSGSTNSAGWQIAFRSDGNGTIEGRAFSVPSDLTARFFRDVQAAFVARVPGRACMKSISFGTRLNATYHGWTSPDLSCPAVAPLGAALADDVGQIVQIAQPPSGLRRMRAPLEPHVAPTGL